MEDIDGGLVRLIKGKRRASSVLHMFACCVPYAGPSQSFRRREIGLPHIFPHARRLRLEKTLTNWLMIDSLKAPQVRYWYRIAERSFIILPSHRLFPFQFPGGGFIDSRIEENLAHVKSFEGDCVKSLLAISKCF